MPRETKFRTEAMASRITQLGIGEALNASLAISNHDEAVETIRSTSEVLSVERFRAGTDKAPFSYV